MPTCRTRGGFGERLPNERGSPNATSMELPEKYVIVVRADSTDEALEESLHLTYLFLMRALRAHQAQGRNGEYEAFAIELLAMLQRHRNVYTTSA